jgi:hypothetical protein
MTPNSTLETVEDYISDARVLLQDVIVPYRYDDPSLLVALNVTMLEGQRLRPDLFLFWQPKSFIEVDNSQVCIEKTFRLPFVFGTVAHALARDQEDYQDSRATAFMNVFQSLLIGVVVPPIDGGSPPQGRGRP